MIFDGISMRLLAGILLLVVMVGCSREAEIQELRQRVVAVERLANDDGVVDEEPVTLEAAYEELLADATWGSQRVSQKDVMPGHEAGSYIVVSGTLKGSTTSFQVFLVPESTNGEVAWYEVNGKRHPGSEYGDFVSAYFLRRQLLGLREPQAEEPPE